MLKSEYANEMELVKEIQNILFEMMIQFHEICKKHNLTYYMVGGTLLGAIRHQGFIPWDDDFDVALPRRDYDRLISIPDSELPENIKILSMEKTNNYPYNFVKIVNKNTTIVEDIGGKGYVMGVYIDVFPLDGAGNCIDQAKKQVTIAKLLRICVLICYAKRKSDKLWKNIIKYIIWSIGLKKWQRLLERTIRKKMFETSSYVSNFLGAWMEKEIMPREFFGTPTLYKFRERWFFGPEKYDKYLKQLYGDYMKLPPLEKQKSHHKFSYINLYLPYHEFLKGVKK